MIDIVAWAVQIRSKENTNWTTLPGSPGWSESDAESHARNMSKMDIEARHVGLGVVFEGETS